jgi:hypothetical protein
LRGGGNVVNWAPMTQEAPRVSGTPAAAFTIVTALGGPGTATVPDMTIADAAAKSGLPLRDAEVGLHGLVAEYRGHLRVTSEGELLFRFPHGFTKPWVTRTWLSEAAGKVGRALLGVARFVVRAWIAIVLVGYVVIFVAILLGLALSRSDDRDRGGGVGFSLIGVVFRVLADALFWMFHPFSPFSYTYRRSSWGSPWGASERAPSPWEPQEPEEPKVPFYEKVNRFFFGPEATPEDPRAMQKKILAEIRAQKGRIGLSDVMRVTGLPRDEADPRMARLMLDYDGTVEVSEEGGIVYRFAEMRRTAAEPGPGGDVRPASVWDEPHDLPPLTGNSFGSNALIMLLNGFNLIASAWVLSNGLTMQRIGQLLSGAPWDKLTPASGMPWALGVVPLVFSIALFVLPLLRALWRPIKARRAARERGRRALVRAVLERVGRRGGVTETELAGAWAAAAGSVPDEKTLTREVVALGGDVDLESAADGVRYRFPDLELEARAVEAEREAAAEDEARVGKVIFSSET